MSITTNGVLVDLNLSVWTGRKLDRQVSNEIDISKQTRTKAGNYNKSLLAGCAQLEKVQSISGKIRNWHLRQTLPWSDTGTRLLPMGNFFDYKQELNKMEQEFDAAVQDFISAYPTLISAAAFQIGALFNRDDYPTEDKIRHKFNIRTVFHPVPLADDFRVEAESALKTELQDQYEKMYREREESTAKELWGRLHEYLTTLVDRLEKKQQATIASANGEKTKAGQFHESHLENGSELCSLLSRLNIMNDPQLEAARKYLESALLGVTVKDIRTSEGTRNEVKARVQSILNRFDF